MNAHIEQELARLKTLLGDWAARFDADLLETCPSTNTLLLERATRGAPSGSVLWALDQTAGRGRRGRGWQSAASASLTFSLLWRFAPDTPLAGLSLAAGLGVAQGLERLGVANIGLKWPNDLWVDGCKLGGILVEMADITRRPAAIIGIGLNVHPLPAERIGHAAAALSDHLAAPDATAILACLLIKLGETLDRFARDGFAPLRDAWMARHLFTDRRVQLIDEHTLTEGQCLGVDASGALLIEQDGKVLRYLGGDVSLRTVEP